MIAISFPPFTAHASASDRIVLLIVPVIRLPAFRSQMNCSAGNPSTLGNSAFNRGSHARQRNHRQFSFSKSTTRTPAVASPATAR